MDGASAINGGVEYTPVDGVEGQPQRIAGWLNHFTREQRCHFSLISIYLFFAVAFAVLLFFVLSFFFFNFKEEEEDEVGGAGGGGIEPDDG